MIVRPRQQPLVFVQSVSVLVAELKWCDFWAAVFVVEVVGRSPFNKSPKISALGVQYF
jgi:hypothetical protein